jgi:hypothetical protein
METKAQTYRQRIERRLEIADILSLHMALDCSEELHDVRAELAADPVHVVHLAQVEDALIRKAEFRLRGTTPAVKGGSGRTARRLSRRLAMAYWAAAGWQDQKGCDLVNALAEWASSDLKAVNEALTICEGLIIDQHYRELREWLGNFRAAA